MKIEEIDAIQYKDNQAQNVKENVVQDETVTLTINGNISRSFSAIEDSLKEFAIGYLFNENMVKSLNDIKNIEIDGPQIRVEIDDRDEKLGYRLRESQIKKVPYTLILGDNEKDNKEISYRLFGEKETTTLSQEDFIKHIKEVIKNKK